MVTPPAMSRWKIAAFWVAIVVLFVGLRALFLDMDAPRQLAHGGLTPELLVEPPAKAHEARNWALTGSFHTNPIDNYQFWRPQAPFWVYPLALSFKVFGITYATLRMTATVLGIGALVGVVVLAHRRWGATGALVAGVFLATDNIQIVFSRSGLLEPVVAAWLALALVALDRAFDHVGWLLTAMLLTVLALGTKLAALPAVPVFLGYGVLLVWRAPGVERRRAWRLAILGVAALVLAGLTVFAMRPEFQRTLNWNFHHMVLGREGGTSIDLDALASADVGPGLRQLPDRFKIAWCALSVVGVFAVIETGLRIVDLVRRRATARDLLPAVVFVAFAAAVFGATFFAFRFVLLLAPPALVLTVDLLHRASRWLRPRVGERRERWLLAGGAVAFAGAHLAAFGFAMSLRTYEIRDAARLIQRRIEGRPDAVCIGRWSAPTVLETTCKQYYVKWIFNSTRAALDELKPTHLILRDAGDDTRTVLQREWPKLLERARRADGFVVRGQGITVFEVPAAPTPTPPEPADPAPP